VVTASGTSVGCSFGGPGEPCMNDADCRSADCQTVVTAGGSRRTCR
jgi:hypothetical protein